jgi:hypothetical protein
MNNMVYDPCVVACPFCDGTMLSIVKPIRKEGVKMFLVDIFIRDNQGKMMPFEVSKKLKAYPNCDKIIYGGRRTNQSFSLQNAQFTVLQLIACGILSLQIVPHTKPIAYCQLGSTSSDLHYTMDSFWQHLYLII